MKRLIFIPLFVLIFSQSAFAEDDYEYESSSRRSSASKFYFGLASNSHMLRTTETALTGIYALSGKSILQGYFLLESSDPNLMKLGIAYKYKVSGSKHSGFHVGGGLGFGDYADDKSFMRILGIAGFHFHINKRVALHVDGGLTIVNDDNPNNDETDSQTLIGGNSSLFGISFIYRI